MTGLENKMAAKTLSSNIAPESQSDALVTTAGSLNGASNTSLNKLAPALAKAQAEMTNATLNKVNPHFRSKYADLAGIRDTVTPVLSKHGLSIVQFTSLTNIGFCLVTRLLHESGQYIEGQYPLPELLDKPQAMGSAVTYARRYTLSAMCGIAAEEDDDGEAAQAANGGRQPKAGAGKAGGGKVAGAAFDPNGGIVL